tara:strand:+ start:1599 stop:2519 length:921 start_codon:yes stop_codon:yes gene_type:complete
MITKLPKAHRRFHFFGTSHTAGGGFEFHKKNKVQNCYGQFDLPKNEHSFSYPGCFERLISNKNSVINHAKCGYGNELIYRKIFEIIQTPEFDKEKDILLIEFSDLGRKEFWNNDLNDFIILNHGFENHTWLGLANTYWYDSKDTVKVLESKREFFQQYIKDCFNFEKQINFMQQNFIMLINFLQNNNIKFYLTNDVPTHNHSQTEYFNVENNLIEYEFDLNIGHGQSNIKKAYNFLALTQHHFHIKQETDSYYNDMHQGYYVNKIVGQTIYNRLIEDGIMDGDKKIIDYSEWDTITQKIKSSISIL